VSLDARAYARIAAVACDDRRAVAIDYTTGALDEAIEHPRGADPGFQLALALHVGKEILNAYAPASHQT
jgi:hypothetical protein